MSLWFRSILLAGALLMAGTARAHCAFVSASTPSWSHSESTTTLTISYVYDCDGDYYAVIVTETWDNSWGESSHGFWQQTVSGPNGSTHDWGTGAPPISRVNLPDFDPRAWQNALEGWAEPDPEY